MKKIAIFLLLISLTAAVAGCAPSQPSADPTQATGSAPAPTATVAASAAETTPAAGGTVDEPVPKEPITLKVWRPIDSTLITGWDENVIYPEIERLTGVTVEWITPAASTQVDHFNLTVSSGDWPDIFYYPPPYNGGAMKAVEDEVYLDLTPMLEEHAPNYLGILDANAQINKEARQDDGRVLALMEVHLSHEAPWAGPWMRTDLLEQVGRPMPETVQEWYETLTAFKNELSVAYPLIFDSPNALVKRNWSVFVGAYGAANAFITNNGTVEYGWIMPGYKDYLAEMAKWYAEGLCDPDFDTREGTDSQALFSAGDAGSLIAAYGNANVWLQSGLDVNPDFMFSAVPYPVLNKGDDPATALHIRQENYMIDGNATYVTTTCVDPGRALEWLDFNYSPEGFLLHNYGVEGVSWAYAPGEPDEANAPYFPQALLGKNQHPEFTDFMLNNPDGYEFWTLVQKYKVHNGPYLRNPNAYFIADLAMASMSIWSPPGSDWFMPNIALNAEEQRRESELMTDIEAYRDGELIKFVKGQRPLAEFDDYVSTMKSMGIDEWIAIKQAGLDRYNSR